MSSCIILTMKILSTRYTGLPKSNHINSMNSNTDFNFADSSLFGVRTSDLSVKMIQLLFVKISDIILSTRRNVCQRKNVTNHWLLDIKLNSDDKKLTSAWLYDVKMKSFFIRLHKFYSRFFWYMWHKWSEWIRNPNQ